MDIIAFSIRRSGTHAITNWILHMLRGPILYVHNATIQADHERSTSRAFLPRATLALSSDEDLYPVSIPIVTRKQKKDMERKQTEYAKEVSSPMVFNNPFFMGDPDERGNTFLGSPSPVPEHRYYGFENSDPSLWEETQFASSVNWNDAAVVLSLRDPIDVAASAIAYAQKMEAYRKTDKKLRHRQNARKGKQQSAHDVTEYRGLLSPNLIPLDLIAPRWKQISEYMLAEYEEGLTVIPVVYDIWNQNVEYRREIAKSMGLEFSDRGKSFVSSAGGGSSFDGTEVKADDLTKRSKGRELYAANPHFREFVNTVLIPELNEPYKQLFGTDLDPTVRPDFTDLA